VVATHTPIEMPGSRILSLADFTNVGPVAAGPITGESDW